VEKVRTLVIGAGISGLSFAAWLGQDDCLVLEAEATTGGYCRTIEQDGFTWDYSGHFFHFRHKEIERYLVDRMEGQRVLEVAKESRIWFDGTLVDFPFQKNIHQLPKQDFIDCLVDLYFRDEQRPVESFLDMLYARFGRSIAEKFLVPYNEKLYATDLGALDADAMGRFFPYADVDEIVANFRTSDNTSYNATFTYPERGAIQYVRALEKGVSPDRIALGERLLRVDLGSKVATTSKREIVFDRLVSTIPFVRLLELAAVPHDPGIYTYNKVQVFNLGFDRKGPRGVHWIYYPQRELGFYRVGFYDNIFGADRMSLYVEIGRRADESIDVAEQERALSRVLADLARVGIVDGHRLVSHHHVVLDPAYVHITRASVDDVGAKKAQLAALGIYSIGRYGSWTYCSIEDNIVEARALADVLSTAERLRAPARL
jgi:protoporphyrinogen oxidase